MSSSRSMPVFLAGWFTVIAGVLAVSNGLMVFQGESSSPWLDLDFGLDRYTVCGSMIIIFGAVTIAGGISALRGWNLSLALAGAALGTISDGLAGFWLGIASIALLFMSNEDF